MFPRKMSGGQESGLPKSQSVRTGRTEWVLHFIVIIGKETGPERVRDLPKVTQELEEHPGQTLDL